jgi:hypothetical protein
MNPGILLLLSLLSSFSNDRANSSPDSHDKQVVPASPAGAVIPVTPKPKVTEAIREVNAT